MRLRHLVAVSAVTVLAAPIPAAAFVPYRTSGTELEFHWPVACVPLRVYADDLLDMTPEEVMRAAQGAAAAWSAAANPCSRVNIVVERASGPGPQSVYDGANTITFRRTSWCAPSDPPGTCSYDPSATTVTSVFVSRSTGEIRDSDIEVNAKSFLWGDVVAQPDVAKQDLQNVLTHEMGHVLGFDHSCFSTGFGNPPLDDMGNPAPDCETAGAAVRETTMFASFLPNDITKRTLEADDQRAVCTTYPSPSPDAGAGAAPPPFAACLSALEASRDAGADGGGGAGDAPPLAVPDAAGHGDAPSLPVQDGCGCALGEGNGGSWPLGLGLLILLARPRARRTMAPTYAHRRLRL